MSNTIHVLQIVGNPVGGIRRHVHTLLFELPKTGICQSYAYSTIACDMVFKKEIKKLSVGLENRLIPLKIFKKPKFGDIINLMRLRNYIRKNKVNIVHGHGAKGGAYARLLGVLCDVKAIYTPHGGAVHDMFGKLENFIYTIAEKVFFSMTTMFMFESKYSAQAYFKKINRKSSNWMVNYNGIAVPFEKSFSKTVPIKCWKTINIGVFGILRREKGQIYAIQAMSEILKSYDNIFLHIYGDGPNREFLIRESKKLSFSDKILFHGETEYPLRYMEKMDIILIPSVFESFGYVAIEAFSVKRPVIASNIGGLPEIISDGLDCFLVPVASSIEIATSVLKLIDQPELARKMGESGYKKVASSFPVDSMLSKLVEVYEQVRLS